MVFETCIGLLSEGSPCGAYAAAYKPAGRRRSQ